MHVLAACKWKCLKQACVELLVMGYSVLPAVLHDHITGVVARLADYILYCMYL